MQINNSEILERKKTEKRPSMMIDNLKMMSIVNDSFLEKNNS
jgi:hypothetical protein